MRGIAAVLSLAFVFAASSALLVGTAAAQADEPMPPEEYDPEPTDAVLQGVVRDAAGRPVAGASVSAYNYGGPVYAASDEPASGGGSGGSSGATEPARMPYYGGNSTTTGPDGSYRLGVYSGSNQVSVYQDGYSSASAQVEVQAGQTVTQDLTVQKFPDKTARIEGRVTDARNGAGLAFASVSVNSPAFGRYECSLREGEGGGSSGGEVKPMPAQDSPDGDAASTSIVAPDHSPGCAITVHSDGSYEGLVTPGYSIVSVYAYSDCAVSSDADGSSSSSCGPQYFSASRSLDLPANETTVVNVALRSLPGPNAVVSGYLIDAETGEGIPDAQVSFSNQETYGYGWAITDGDGSYSLRLRSGFHQVSVHAPGHLPWEGNLDVDAGESDFDVELTPGEPAYGGGCCWLMEGRGGIAAMDGSAAPPGAPNPASAELDESGTDDAQQQVLYEDLGGGLGPYDASEREQHLAAADGGEAESGGGNGIPGAGALLALAALVGAAFVARRRA